MESSAHPGEPLIVPGDPEGSWLYHKMSGLQNEEGDVPMPIGIGSGNSHPELPLVEAWIRDGAPAECDELMESRLAYDPTPSIRAASLPVGIPTAPEAHPLAYGG